MDANGGFFEDYKVDLDVFEGPLDLLLYLIRRDELDIYDIPIEHIARQYMEHLDLMRMLDLDIAGEFLIMATTLMMIKSRMLLPVEARSADADGDEDWEDPRLDLVRQLIEYKKFKDAAKTLMEREVFRGESFAYGGEVVLEQSTPEVGQLLGDIGLFDLLSAFQGVLEKAPFEPFGHLEPIRWSIPDKMEVVIEMTRKHAAVRFTALFSQGAMRGEVIITFLALLELLRLRHIRVTQDAAFHEIVIEAVPDGTPDSYLPLPSFGTSLME